MNDEVAKRRPLFKEPVRQQMIDSLEGLTDKPDAVVNAIEKEACSHLVLMSQDIVAKLFRSLLKPKN